MTTAFDDTGQHSVTSTIAAVSQQLCDIADLGLWTLSQGETDANLTALARLRHQIPELELRHAQHADRLNLGAQAGGVSEDQAVVIVTGADGCRSSTAGRPRPT